MPMPKETLLQYLQDTFVDANIHIHALQNDDDHWAITIESSAFQGKTKIQQHQMVYDSLKGHVGGALHALQLKTKAI